MDVRDCHYLAIKELGCKARSVEEDVNAGINGEVCSHN